MRVSHSRMQANIGTHTERVRVFSPSRQEGAAKDDRSNVAGETPRQEREKREESQARQQAKPSQTDRQTDRHKTDRQKYPSYAESNKLSQIQAHTRTITVSQVAGTTSMRYSDVVGL